LRFLFLVSILQSSQNTKESLLFGSECSSKHALHILWPHDKVNGSYRKLRQLKQLRLYSKGCKCYVFFSIMTSIWVMISVAFTIYLDFSCKLYSVLTSLGFSCYIYSLNVFSVIFTFFTSHSAYSIFRLISAISPLSLELSALSFIINSCEAPPSDDKSFNYFWS